MVFFCVFTIRNYQKSSFHIIFGWTSLDFPGLPGLPWTSLDFPGLTHI